MTRSLTFRPRPLAFATAASIVSLVAALPVAKVAYAKAAQADTLVIGPDLAIDVAVNGVPLRFKASPSASPTLILNPASATRIGLGKGLFGAQVNIGPTAVEGRTAVLNYVIDGVPSKKRSVAFDRAIAPGLDGVIGPGAMAHRKIVFRLRAPVSGERQITLPLVDQGFTGSGTMISLEGEDVFVKWALQRQPTIATAGAAAAIAVVHDGRLQGEAARTTIAFDVQRPVRRLLLGKPLVVGPVLLDSLQARTADYGDASEIGEADASEIVVRAKGKSSGRTIRVLEIGSDAMQHCSSLIFDKPARKIIFSCR